MAKKIEYMLEGQIITLTTTTLIRLYAKSTDAVALYLFYIKTSIIQKNTSIYATDEFCKKGCNWGDKRFRKAKNILLEGKFIEQITKPIKGVGKKYFIRIHYFNPNGGVSLEHPSKGVTPLEHTLEGGTPSESTNAVNEKQNTVNEKEKGKDTSVSFPKKVGDGVWQIFSEWNKSNLSKHYRINGNMEEKVKQSLLYFSTEQIISAIRNYNEIVNDDKYYFKYKWTLVEFLSRGSSKQGLAKCGGFQRFLPENNPHFNFLIEKPPIETPLSEVDKMKNEFNPITVTYQKHNLLDKTRNTYFGFETDRLKDSRLMQSNLADVKWSYGRNEFNYGDFKWLEEIIASIYFNRKAVLDMELLKMLIGLHEEYKSKFKQEAIKNLGG